MNTVEETLRNVSRRSRHDKRGSGSSTGADWSAPAVRGPAQPTPVAAPAATSTAFARPQDITGPTRRQSSRDSVDSAGQHTPPDHADLLFKVMLLGDSGVGKTCLLTRFRDGRFLSGNYITTVGIDFRNKVVTVDDTPIKLQIWDTAGQERFRSVTHAYYRDAHALLLLYDVTNKTSYDNIRAWLSEIREHANEDVVIMLLGNKSDCGTERAVKREDGERLAQEYKVPFMETSAKTGLNVELAFLAVARELKARKSDNPDGMKFNVQDYVRQQSQRSSCFNSSCLTT
ncbi:PREDICTED: ras-related protein Rab-37-like isoform X2 [Trachymyrmex septentrionalis]|uniref:ras-related protein Rab-37-like isoform X2 n=1 Tax=Trachymyrmex septentrionalis TaxID=34720 RepID=UPI00084F762B|nr:PREDICTED: ras-related protein Rab-37-like isoform X2 [Trachymyrmex septentrionalis]XP_018349186.1 PREDICTED: ras-related protein Rab-37-like isoform X2 [Trachymyrmex septentrionalis]XP_018349187.1 PREDICTED: ras-related protein Rab-37-like isoform X2 [Trachymyrmex septentrionalis]XP_018349188.1 PREDICTED: ras-related protein Rab-37-like isoform X2 [Trachymyrmex septentrionalis]XP_018349189.1 PREDICTED: ras-related protein Rab-37-like isoform X2 [Trachymyrmex septentrionalis]